MYVNESALTLRMAYYVSDFESLVSTEDFKNQKQEGRGIIERISRHGRR